MELQDCRSFRWTKQSWWLTTKSFDCYVSFSVSRPDTNKDSEGSEDEAKSSCVPRCNINCYKNSFFNLTWLREGCAPCDLDLEPRSLTPLWTNIPSPRDKNEHSMHYIAGRIGIGIGLRCQRGAQGAKEGFGAWVRLWQPNPAAHTEYRRGQESV